MTFQRLETAKTRRGLGFDLATVKQILDHEASLSDVAILHADALNAQIRILRLRRAGGGGRGPLVDDKGFEGGVV